MGGLDKYELLVVKKNRRDKDHLVYILYIDNYFLLYILGGEARGESWRHSSI